MAVLAFARIVPAAVALTVLAPSAVPSAESPQTVPRTVLTLYWSSESYPGTQKLDSIIQETLQSRAERIDYFAEYLESDRFPDEQASVALRDYIQQKFRGRRIDLVIAITGPALTFALRFRANLFPDAPIVFSVPSTPDAVARQPGPGLTGLVYGSGFGETLQLALKLHPSATRVFYVAEAPNPAVRESMRTLVLAAAHGVAVTEIDEPTVPRLVAAVKAVPRGSVLLYVRYSRDEAGNVLYPTQIAPLLAQAATVPVYGVVEAFLGSGIVGGVMLPQQVLGTRIGELASEILHGARPQDIPIDHPQLVPMFDWRQLQRWGIAEDSLPPHSVLLFQEISIWERDRTAILVTIGVLLLQSFLIVGLMVERRRRRRAEMESRQHLAAMAHLDRRAAMGELASSLAHELNQPLNAILQNAGVAQMLLGRDDDQRALDELREIIGDIRKDDIRAGEVIRRMRGLLQKHDLETQAININELATDTLALVRSDAASRDVQLDVQLAEPPPPLVGDRVHLQQVVLNLLLNAVDAVAKMPPGRRRVVLGISRDKGEVRVWVRDSGAGITAERPSEIFEAFYTTKREGMGMGLAIARSIVEAHEGRIAAENNEGGGATVWFTVPAREQVPS